MTKIFLIGVLFLLGFGHFGIAQASESLTPSDRIRYNAERAKENPDLKGRWDPKYYVRSERAARSDNMAMEIISHLQKDGISSERPAHLKIKSYQGNVILDGTARTAEDRALYESKIRAIPDVKSVENNMKVGSVLEVLKLK